MEIIKHLGGRKYMGAADLLIPGGEEAEITLLLSEEETGSSQIDLIIKINFDDNNEAGVSFEPGATYTNMVLRRWNSIGGTSLVRPFEVARIENKFCIEMMMSNYRLGTTNSLKMQFWKKML